MHLESIEVRGNFRKLPHCFLTLYFSLEWVYSNSNSKLLREPLPSRLEKKRKQERKKKAEGIAEILNFVSIVFLEMLMKEEWGIFYLTFVLIFEFKILYLCISSLKSMDILYQLCQQILMTVKKFIFFQEACFFCYSILVYADFSSNNFLIIVSSSCS